MTLCARFGDCPFLKNFHVVEEIIGSSTKISRPNYGKFLTDKEAVMSQVMTYVCNEHPEKCLFYGKK